MTRAFSRLIIRATGQAAGGAAPLLNIIVDNQLVVAGLAVNGQQTFVLDQALGPDEDIIPGATHMVAFELANPSSGDRAVKIEEIELRETGDAGVACEIGLEEPSKLKFQRAFSAAGSLIVDGKSFDSTAAADFSFLERPDIDRLSSSEIPRPVPASDLAALYRSHFSDQPYSFEVRNLPNGRYRAYLYSIDSPENRAPGRVNLYVQNRMIGSVVAGEDLSWEVVQFDFDVTDGRFTFATGGAVLALAGFELHRLVK